MYSRLKSIGRLVALGVLGCSLICSGGNCPPKPSDEGVKAAEKALDDAKKIQAEAEKSKNDAQTAKDVAEERVNEGAKKLSDHKAKLADLKTDLDWEMQILQATSAYLKALENTDTTGMTKPELTEHNRQIESAKGELDKQSDAVAAARKALQAERTLGEKLEAALDAAKDTLKKAGDLLKKASDALIKALNAVTDAIKKVDAVIAAYDMAMSAWEAFCARFPK